LAPAAPGLRIALVTACLLTPAALPARAAQPPPPRLDASAAALLSADTGQLLYGQAPRRELAIASATKLMTALVTLEHSSLQAVFTEPDYTFAAVDSQIGLVPGEKMTVHYLLLALMLPSADDAAEDLAFNVGGGSVARFLTMMNTRARQLGLTHTHYSTPIGFDTPGNYSSAADLVKLARYLLHTQPFIRAAVARPSAELSSGLHPRLIVNRNDLVGRFPWINGVKTGHTIQAGYVLVGSGTRGGMTLISAVLGTPSEAERDASTLSLLSWGFANFRLATPVRAGTVIARPRVRYRPGKRAWVVADWTFRQVVPRVAAVTLRAHVPAMLAGPLRRGARVGTLVVLAGGRVIGRVPLVLAVALPAASPPGGPLGGATTLVLVLVLAALAVRATGFRARRRRATAAQRRRRNDHHRHAKRSPR
jgi:D-alanyl-D-alanine carboxypeptidase (penicillin-binding protein 5/6)